MRKTEEQYWNMLYSNYVYNLKVIKHGLETPKTFEDFKATYPYKTPYDKKSGK